MTKDSDVVAGLSTLLAAGSEESDLQRYLEQHPWLLLRYPPDPPLVVSQLPLGPDYRADFAYFFWTSAGSYLQLIEIESPRLEIFNRDDHFSAKFNAALQQLEDWAIWSRRHPDSIAALFEPLCEQGLIKQVPLFSSLRLLLIAGRRSQISNTLRRRRWEERIARQSSHTEIRTLEGFIESIGLATGSHWKVPCVRYRKQSYEVLS